MKRAISITSSNEPIQALLTPRVSPTDHRERDLSDDECRSAKRRLPFREMTQTQEIDYTPNSQAEPQAVVDAPMWTVQDGSGRIEHVYANSRVKIGRNNTNDIVVKDNRVSKFHAVLQADNYSLTVKSSMTNKPIWHYSHGRQRWEKSLEIKLYNREHRFRLLPPTTGEAQPSMVEFKVCELGDSVRSMDEQYLCLLHRVNGEAHRAQNKKGPNQTLKEPQKLVVDLSSDDPNENRIQVLTLRNMFGGRPAIIEALWYLRGESHVKFIQDNGWSFWDKQAIGDGSFVGLNYGLLTNFPTKSGESMNQLEMDVIGPLCEGECSRKMNCTMLNPSEATVQKSCSMGLLFSVDDKNTLNLTVIQRSSDVMLGLPHDLLIFQILYHLVRREVRMRTKDREDRKDRILLAGSLIFDITAGAAHVYDINRKQMHQLMQREPCEGMHSLVINSDEHIFDLARNYRTDGPSEILVKGYSKYGAAIKIDQAVEEK